MAFRSSSLGHGQSNSTHSTLSPLAPPFTVDRPRPAVSPSSVQPPDLFTPHPPPAAAPDSVRRYGRAISPGPVRRTLSSNLVQAEPFYPQYGAAGGGGVASTALGVDCFEERSNFGKKRRGAGPWNGPFDEDSGWVKGVSEGSSSWMEPRGRCVGGSSSWMESRDKGSAGSSSWMESSGTGLVSSYASAVQQDGVSSEGFLPYENIWGGKHVEPFVMKAQFESDCPEWLHGKPSMHFQPNATAPVKMSGTPALSPHLAVNASFPCLTGPVASTEVCNTFYSTSGSYDSLMAQHVSCRSEQVGYYPSPTYSSRVQISSPSASRSNASDKGLLKNTNSYARHVDGYNDTDSYRFHLTSKLGEPSVRSNIEVKEVDKSKKINDKTKTDVILESLKDNNSSKGKPSPNLKLSIKDHGNTSNTEPELKFTFPSTNAYAETGHSDENSEALDQLNLAVDSPCWKGASASRNSPFHVDDARITSSPCMDQKFENANIKDPDGLTVTVVTDEKTSKFSGGLESEKDVLLLEDHKISIQFKDYDAASPCKSGSTSSSAMPPMSGNGVVNQELVPKGSLVNGRMSKPSLSGASHPDTFVEALKPSASSGISHKSTDVHFLAQSLHDLSLFLSSYCADANVLKEPDHELLVLAIDNLHSCISKRDGLAGPGSVFKSQTSYQHEKPSDSSQVFEKGLKETLYAQEDCPETSIYKKLWIEAEVAFCSAKYELQLARMKVGQEDCKQQQQPRATDSQGLSDAEAKQVNVHIRNYLSDPVREDESPAHAKENLSNDTSTLGKDSVDCITVKPQEFVPSSVSSKLEDVDASVMARLRVLKGRTDKVDSRSAEPQQKLQDLAVGGTSAVRQTVPGNSSMDSEFDVQFQPSLAGSTSARNPCRFYPHELEYGEPEARSGPSVQHVGACYKNGSFDEQYLGSSYSHEVGLQSGLSGGYGGLREFHVDAVGRSTFQPNASNYRHMKRYIPSRYDSTYSDWEHVQKDELI